MPDFMSMFPSRYLKAVEIEQGYDCTIKAIVTENVAAADKPTDNKLVAHFNEDGCKPIVLNVTRGEAIAEIAKTRDYLKWPGTRVHVEQGSTRFNGKKTPCIVITEPELPF
jgi:hypothetical protein